MGKATVHLPNLQRAREKVPLKQTELMEKAGIKSRTTISRIENGYPAEIDTARRLADALGVSLDYLRGVDGASAPLGGRRRPSVQVLEERLARFQEHGEESWQKWSLLQAQAQLLLERTRREETRDRAEEVARQAYNGMLDALPGIDRNDPDAIQAIDEMLDDSREVAEEQKTEEKSQA